MSHVWYDSTIVPSRYGLTDTPYEATIVIATDNSGADIYASFDWEEISR